jgi:hypothetical protein
MKARVSSGISSNTSRVSRGDKFLLSLEKVHIYLLDPNARVMNEKTLYSSTICLPYPILRYL